MYRSNELLPHRGRTDQADAFKVKEGVQLVLVFVLV
jgi:hypothetical protein